MVVDVSKGYDKATGCYSSGARGGDSVLYAKPWFGGRDGVLHR